MSRRFGRNQRRKMRDEIATQAMLRRQAEFALKDTREARQKDRTARLQLERELTEWAERIVALLGDDSAFAREMAVERVDASLFASIMEGRPYRAEILPPLRPLSGKDRASDIALARKVIDLFALCAGYEPDAITMRRRFMIRSTGAGGEYALLLDERTRQQLSSRGDAELTRYLLTQIVEPFMRGPGR